ncbi:PTS cellobiose transporter subunit IIC [Brachyspira pilosicoli]|uniref:Permease IIC component n=4 Tax=Brachyspira TaxID=29521 RepID=D8IEP1_BRAP9|nr:PTS cellobiose transporter subunit IIC [Brachyspira pilosicoli]ADK31614.1 PTS system, cellobiose-specific IIC component (celB) [Brachyspira pilosicoli 95/1000]AGA66644.1 PTS system cellobiose-specific transporter subunit IIC CelB [Brachyspira pilosicoli P43/6/78]WIH80443.1 PTS cellobiose transporter subunit IIC [Brachyspira pilosicoli]WIH82646.1 PTS cellobiose transporter subunit IIC [Brachyspira pilosicoli]WIH84882.1 PTS cellobiose transporter subunit IIC [Brachyspira pilosicoli]
MNDKLMTFIENKILPIAAKIASNRYLNAIRDGFVFAMPFLIVGSFILLILNLPFTDKNNFLYMEWYDNLMKAFKGDLVQPFYVSMGIMSLFVAYGIGYSLSGHYNLNSITGGFLSLFSFLLVSAKVEYVPIVEAVSKSFLVDADSYIPVMDVRFMDAKGLFVAIIFGIVSIEIFRFLVHKKLIITLPESVPPAIAKSFELLIPVAVVIVLFQALNIIIQKKLIMMIPELVMKIFEPLLHVSDSLPSIIILLLVIHILWFAGLHGTNIVDAIVKAITLSNLAINQAALQAGEPVTKIFAGGFFDSYVFMGGVGTTLGLAIAMVRSKNEHIKSIGKLSIVPAVFNINEPIMFGAPVVMNPVLMIPFIALPIINATIAWIFTKLNIIGHIVSLVPWTTPGPLAALLATNLNVGSMILSLVLIFTSYLAYIPFLKAYEISLEKEESANK